MTLGTEALPATSWPTALSAEPALRASPSSWSVTYSWPGGCQPAYGTTAPATGQAQVRKHYRHCADLSAPSSASCLSTSPAPSTTRSRSLDLSCRTDAYQLSFSTWVLTSRWPWPVASTLLYFLAGHISAAGCQATPQTPPLLPVLRHRLGLHRSYVFPRHR